MPSLSSPEGEVTISTFPPTDTSVLNADTSHTGTSGLVAPTLVISTTAPGTTSTITASATSSPSSSSSGPISTGAIIGLTVGVFALLAVALIVFMTIRYKKRRQGSRSRVISAARKSWSRLNDDREPPQLQMRATNLAKTASIAESNTRTGEDSLNSRRALVLKNKAALPSDNPFLSQPPSNSGHTQDEAAAPLTPSHSTDESHIPNPFTSPKGSPSHSRSVSHTSTYSSHDHSATATTALSSFTQHTPQYGHASTITASSYSDYPHEIFAPSDESSSAVKSAGDAKPLPAPASARLVRKPSTKAEESEARSRELKAMQDLISALDERPQNKRAPPSAFDLRVNTSGPHGKSRLSMGEGLVTPGGHSLLEEDAVLVYDEDGSPYWTHAPSSTLVHESFPLPPVQVFRAALSPGRAKEDEVEDDPFRK